MSKEEILNNLKTKIKDIETRPHARSMLEGIKKADPDQPVAIQDNDPQMKPKLIWSNLKKNLCVKCGKELTWSNDGKMIKCVVCDFKIGIDKFDKYSKKYACR